MARQSRSQAQAVASGGDGDVDMDVTATVTMTLDDAQVVFDSMECTLRNNVFSKIECQLYSRMALNVIFTIGERKAADKLLGVCDVKLFNKGQSKVTRIKNLRLEFCELKKHTETRSLLGQYYQAIRKAVANFPDKCPFQKNTTYFINRLNFIWQTLPQYLPEANYSFNAKIYANNKLGLEIKLKGGFYEIGNISEYIIPLI
ncbi:uncharacterized protein LOC122818141 [Drosophila biarmipes]|uniref:uncharacterized protein LOC122818141 n=1 Tax=Drosophila biarmipes TaxID=125945 RepID=UPI0021CC5CE2|nr:uncharacterized protein LOC122818141 [Drosophila biarmipes]